MTKTEYFESNAGQLKPLPTAAAELFAVNGRVRPEGSEVVELPAPKWWRSNRARRIAIYAANGSRPFPLGEAKVNGPKELSPADVINLFGPYLSGLLTRALKLAGEVGKMTAKDWVVIIVSGLGFLTSAATLIVVVKVFRDSGLL